MALIDKLTAIADAIRGKTGGTEKLTLDQMATEIAGIKAGDGDASAIDSLIDRSITEISSNATRVGKYAFSSCATLTTAIFPAVMSIETNAFSDCTALTTVNLPAATIIETNAFRNCATLTTVNFPAVTRITGYAFSNCATLTTANFPVATRIVNYAFSNCASLIALILRSDTLCDLTGINAFSGCLHILGTQDSTYNPDGLKDGYIYVPSALVETYKAATNWSTFATQFRALEDYTIDGTITGELDPARI